MEVTHNSNRRLTVAVVARNADDIVGETLRSVQGLANEIVVANIDGSERVDKLGVEWGASAISGEWNHDFSAVCNRLREQATGGWLLWLDAGETIDEEAAWQLRSFIDEQADRSKAYWLLVKSPRRPGAIAGEQIARPKLIPNIETMRFRGKSGMEIDLACDEAGLTTEGIPWAVQIGTWALDPDRLLDEAAFFQELATSELNAHGPNPRVLNRKGNALQTAGQLVLAVSCFTEAIRLSNAESPDLLESYYGLLTALDRNEITRTKCTDVCLKALESFPVDCQLLCALGSYLQTSGRVELARKAYQAAHEHGQIEPRVSHLGETLEIATVCYSLALQLDGQDEEAEIALKQRLVHNPASLRIKRQLADLYIKRGMQAEAITLAPDLAPNSASYEPIGNAIRGACLAAQSNWTAAKVFLEAAYSDHCIDPICLRSYATTLLAIGQRDAARGVLETWKDVDSFCSEPSRLLDRLSNGNDPDREQPKAYRADEGVESTAGLIQPAHFEHLQQPLSSVDQGLEAGP